MHDQSRAERLPDKDQLATGQVWIAPVAYDIGLIDALGSNLDAIQKAAELAQVTNYEVIDLTFLTLFGDPTYIGSALPPDLSTLS
ncbi:S49 family peptidase [candidate division KSB1 bacterium]|nr:S49 family peptidase [candidate division KSB1 bacterium]